MPKFSALTIESQTALKNRIGDDLDLEQDLNTSLNGERAITHAVKLRNKELIQDLCNNDICLDFYQDGRHSGVLVLAINSGLADIVEILLKAYIKKHDSIPDHVADIVNFPSITYPFRWIGEWGDSQVNYSKTRLLVEEAVRNHLPKPTHPPSSGEAAFKDLKDTSQTLLDKWSRGMTASKLIKANSINTPLEVEVSFIGRPIVAQYAITYAVILGDEGLVEDLCANGVNLTVRDRENLGKTPLELAEEHGNSNIHRIITSHASSAPTHV